MAHSCAIGEPKDQNIFRISLACIDPNTPRSATKGSRPRPRARARTSREIAKQDRAANFYSNEFNLIWQSNAASHRGKCSPNCSSVLILNNSACARVHRPSCAFRARVSRKGGAFWVRHEHIGGRVLSRLPAPGAKALAISPKTETD